MNTPGTRQAAAKVRPDDPARRPAGVRAGDVLAVAALVVGAGLIEYFLRHLLTRPFYYDEASRAYEIAEGGRFLTHLSTAAAPLALGWVGIENAARLVLGDSEAALRAPMFAALPVLGVATYVLSRRWLGVALSFCVAALMLVNLWIVNYALQLKSYSYEALFAVTAVGLYLLMQRTTWRWPQLLGLAAALGLTCVFSLPNLFVVGPLLVLEFVRAIRDRQQAALRIGGVALAGAIALIHYVAFVRPQSGVATTGFFAANYPPPGLAAFVRFAAQGFASYVPSMVVGIEGGAANAAPTYALAPALHGLLAVVLVLLLAAGVVASVRDAAGRALITAIGGALLLELAGSAMHRWPFGLLRANIFLLPLLYILCGIGGAWLGRTLRGPRRPEAGAVGWLRAAGLGAAALALVVTASTVAVATVGGFAGTSRLESKPTMFGGVKAAVADARRAAVPGDLVIIRADRSPPDWYAAPWLYYMTKYRGYPPQVASLPSIPARNTISVVYVTPGAVDRFLAAHAGSPAVFLLEFNLPGYRFPRWAHQESLTTLRRFGYCAISNVAYPVTGHLTILKADCPKA